MSVDRSPIYISNEAIKAGSLITCRETYGGIFLLYAAKKGQVAEGKAYRGMKANETVTEGLDFRMEKRVKS